MAPFLKYHGIPTDHREVEHALDGFIRDSNAIEGIRGVPAPGVMDAYREFLNTADGSMSIYAIEAFVDKIDGGPLRVRPNMNVRVGQHVAPPGGTHIPYALATLLEVAEEALLSPIEVHNKFLWLHPFIDGNGRAGRLLWLYYRFRHEDPACVWGDIRARPLLQTLYYQQLQAADDLAEEWFDDRGMRF